MTPRVDEHAPILFPTWERRLRVAPLTNEMVARFGRDIAAYLAACRRQRSPASVASIREYLTRQPAARDALRWFYREAQKPSTLSVPPPAARDLGGADWERDLVRAVRERGYLWRTEETYRAWAARFASFIKPESPYRASERQVAAFLSELAVKQRAMPSTQKQALNAIVFLLREALRRNLGPIEFHRAYPRRRMPTVLTSGECQRLFAQLDGTTRLMAELAYGAGLRLMELLRLRVQHVDFDRRQLKVAGGKGDKDRVTMLPEKLVEPLRAHVKRLRELHEQDRQAGIAGVWLPEGLARKYPKAGERFAWQWLFPSRETSIDPVSKVRGVIMSSTVPFKITSVGRRNAPRSPSA